MGNNCCTISENNPNKIIQQQNYSLIELPAINRDVNQQANNHYQQITDHIFSDLKNKDAQNFQRITEFIIVNKLECYQYNFNNRNQSAQQNNQQNSKDKLTQNKYESKYGETIKMPDKYFFGDLSAGKAQGTGLLYYQNLYYYLGSFREGEINGKGILHFLNLKHNSNTQLKQQQYDGEFVDGKAHGHGKFTRKSKKPYQLVFQIQLQYLGEWVNGQPSSGSVKFGPLSNIRNIQITDIQTRQGIIYMRNGGYYKGHLSQKLEPEGIGIYTLNKQQYTGSWLKGKFHGYGRYIWQNGQIYQGNYSNGKKQGQGKFIFQSGKYYEGNWMQGRQNGRGTLYQQGGTIIKRGLWNSGQFNIAIPEQQWKQE